MFDYDQSQFRPPAPTYKLVLKGESPDGSAATVTVNMLIDTGSDLTCIPKRVMDQLFRKLGVTELPHGFTVVQGFEGAGTRSAKQYELTVQPGDVGGGRDWLFTVTTASIGFLGRDILNAHILELNGPNLRWSFQ